MTRADYANSVCTVALILIFILFSSEITSNQEFLGKQQQQYNIEKPQIVLYQ